MTEKAAERLVRERGTFTFSEWYRWRYLKSDHWTRLRAAKLSAEPRCERCRRAASEQVHHLRYRSIYDVTLIDLQAVCRDCHRGAHNITAPDAPRAPYWRSTVKKKSADSHRQKTAKRALKKAGMSREQAIAWARVQERGRL